MDGIKAWVLSICLASFAAGILQYLSPQNKHNSVIKLVLTLYILVAAFAPVQSLKYPDTRIAVPEVPAQENIVDTESIIKEQARANIEEQLYEACASKGYPLESLTAVTKDYTVVSVTAVASDSENADAVKSILTSELGEQTVIIVNVGE